MDQDFNRKVELLKAAADEIRLKIIDMLKDGELCACKILKSFQITQPTLSYHMRILTQCGLVSSERKGAWMRYTLNEDVLRELTDIFLGLTANQIKNEKCACRNGEREENINGEHRCHRLMEKEPIND